ncbi:TonB-dependent siderophore receptor [Alicycliphilus sp. B1]|nr:TonB-dependent siderophore receptor [Alicycliphilus sp. B1]
MCLTGAFSLFGRRHEVIGGLALSQAARRPAPPTAAGSTTIRHRRWTAIADLFAYGGGNAAPTFGASGHSSSIAVFHLKQDNLAVWQAQYPGSYGFYGAPRNLVAGLKYAF